MNTIEDLICNGWVMNNKINLFIDYKRLINNSDILSELKITEYIKCKHCNKNVESKLIKKNKYILTINNDILSTLPIELRDIGRLLQLVKLFIQNKLIYDIKIYKNYLSLTLQYRLYNVLNKVTLHLLNFKIYECFKLYTGLSTTLGIYRADITKQNEFENIRRQLLLLDKLGPYSNLKNVLKNKLHNADFYKKDEIQRKKIVVVIYSNNY